jgi:hypothetical protein
MRHARKETLDQIEPLLNDLRALPGIRERKHGIFYRGAVAFLHFHEDPAGLFADLKVNGKWQRMQADTTTQQARVLKAATAAA